MKLEEGMYVRYKSHYRKGKYLISKLEEIMPADDVVHIDTYYLENRDVCLKQDFKKASHKIIDLIEVGDYVNGFRVVYINHKYEYLEVSDEEYIINKEDIKSIVTKEQFESMSYKI